MHVTICILTYKRPDHLQRLLEALEQQELQTPAPALDLVIVDNDADESGRPAVLAAASDRFESVTYVVEPRRGIARARNVAVANCPPTTDLIAMVDDDEMPIRGWLQHLLDCHVEHRADVVFGPVVPDYESEPPAWLLAGRFHDRPRHATGTPVPTGGTGNVLIRTSVLHGVPGPFDPRFNLSGGEDTHLFSLLKRRGARLVWCDEAVAHEHVPASRSTPTYILQRAYRIGCSLSHVRIALDARRASTRLRLVLGAVRALLLSVARLPRLARRGRAARLAGMRDAAQSLGRLVGAFGYSYKGYR